MQEYWSWLPFPPPGNLPDPGIEHTSLVSPHWQTHSLTDEPERKPQSLYILECDSWKRQNCISTYVNKSYLLKHSIPSLFFKLYFHHILVRDAKSTLEYIMYNIILYI